MSRRMPGSCLRSRRWPPAVAAGAAAVLSTALAACGSLQAGSAGATAPAGTGGAGLASSGAATSTASPASSVSSPAAACTAAGLKVALDTAAAGVAAGSYDVPLEFTNTTSQPCQLAGFPAVALTSGVAGRQLGPQAVADRSVQSAAVLLAPGATAHAWLQVSDAASYPASKCHPATAAGMRVAAPGAQSASYLAHRLPACKAALAGSQILTVHPVQPGRAKRGTA